MQVCNKLIIKKTNDITEGHFHVYIFEWYYDENLIEIDMEKIDSFMEFDLNQILQKKSDSMIFDNLIIDDTRK
jgi:hypothetical protein